MANPYSEAIQEIAAEIVSEVVIQEEMRLVQAIQLIVLVERILAKYDILDAVQDRIAFHDMCWGKFGRTMRERQYG